MSNSKRTNLQIMEKNEKGDERIVEEIIVENISSHWIDTCAGLQALKRSNNI